MTRAGRRGERGLVLAQVLVLSVLAAIIAAGILVATLQPAMNASNVRQGVDERASADAALNRVFEAWGYAGQSCASDAARRVSCGGSPGQCSCSCAVDGVTVASSGPAGGPCSLSIARSGQ